MISYIWYFILREKCSLGEKPRMDNTHCFSCRAKDLTKDVIYFPEIALKKEECTIIVVLILSRESNHFKILRLRSFGMIWIRITRIKGTAESLLKHYGAATTTM